MRATLVLLLAGAGAGALLGCAACASAPASAGEPPMSGAPAGQTVVPGEYIVTLARAGDAAQVGQILARFAPRLVKDLGGGRFLVALDKDPGAEAMRDLPRQDDRVKAVQPNFVYRISQ